ncbi:MAG: hypothetical protein ABEJ24_02420 [Candidatus Magasanikbacteria bacterium]
MLSLHSVHLALSVPYTPQPRMVKGGTEKLEVQEKSVLVPPFFYYAAETVFHGCESLDDIHQRIDLFSSSGGSKIEPEVFGLEPDCPTDQHHIIPKAKNGPDESKNIVKPIPKEAHKKFHWIFEDLLPYPQHYFIELIFQQYRVSGREIEKLRNTIALDKNSAKRISRF